MNRQRFADIPDIPRNVTLPRGITVIYAVRESWEQSITAVLDSDAGGFGVGSWRSFAFRP
jgi:hypothetical protein